MNLQERLEYCRAAARGDRPTKFPVYGNMWTWAIYDSGYKLSEAFYDWDIMFDAWMKLQENYNMDYYCNPGARNPFRFTEALDGNHYTLNKENDTLQYLDFHTMEAEEYDEFIKDVKKFRWETSFPRKMRGAHDASPETLKLAFKELMDFLGFKGRLSEAMQTQYGCPERSQHEIAIPYEELFNQLRGIKNLSIDLRRRYGKVKEATEAIYNQDSKFANEGYYNNPPENDVYVFDTAVCFLGHSILNQKQWEDLYWPYLLPWFKKNEEMGKTCMVFVEAQIARFADYFNDFKKGQFAIQYENEKVEDIKKAFKTSAIMGGIDTEVLGKGTVEENIDMVKHSIDVCGDAGLTFCPNKMVSYRNDCKSENLKAIMNYLDSYKF